MSERTDRSLRGGYAPLFAVIAVISAVGAGLYLWTATRTSGPPNRPVVQNASSPLSGPRPSEPLAVTLYVPSDGALAAGAASVRRQSDAQSQIKEVVSALLTAQTVSSSVVLRDVKLRELYLDAAGTAYVDLEPAQKELRAAAWEEFIAIYAMVNTITQNFEEIKEVRFLLGGREARTLAGHMDLSASFGRRMDLVKR